MSIREVMRQRLGAGSGAAVAAWWHRLLRLLALLSHELAKGQLSLRAMGLVYTTLLALVPLLAVSFSMLKAFGVHNQIEPLLGRLLAPLGRQGEDLTHQIVTFVSHVKVGVLGTVGLLFLFLTAISLIQKIEEAFNYVWRVPRPRSLARRFSEYLSVITVGPLLVFSAIGITASVTNSEVARRIIAVEPFGSAMLAAGRLLPYLFVIGAFMFLYLFVPNARVRLRSAFVGALVGGVLWQSTGLLFAFFGAASTQWTAVYSGFAIVLLFMVWLYLSWLILLIGSQIAYYHQHLEQLHLGEGRLPLSNRMKERAGLVIMYLVAETHLRGGLPWSADALARRLNMQYEAVRDLAAALTRRGFLLEAASDGEEFYLPACDPDLMPVTEILAAIRSAEEDDYPAKEFRLDLPRVSEILDEASHCADSVLRARSLKSLIPRGEEGQRRS